MATVDITQKYREVLSRIRDGLTSNNILACVNNSQDLTHFSSILDFDEGVFIGEFLEGILDNFDDMVRMYDHKKEEIEPTKTKIGLLVKFLQTHFPPKDDKTKIELYDILVSTRSFVTGSYTTFMREKEIKESPVRGGFETTSQ
ncbi:hypothetical protein MUP77_22270 [Candidatus Bathyarchaeota archaeon]|nr:hypothetical protein [Candidatus Bathyarchaeota archaeon]